MSGEPLGSDSEKIQVFPQWLMDRFGLEEQPFKMLDERMTTYKDLKIPCSEAVNENFLEPLEQEIKAAFTAGYDAVKTVDELKLFQWAGKLLYGILFDEIQAGIRQQQAQGEEFNISQGMVHKFSNLHLMLQSLTLPLVFEDFKPFSVFLFRVDNAPGEFSFRDEINTLTFSLRMNDFGLIVCLQDNNANRAYHRDWLGRVEGLTLHPVQFEEVCGRVFYSAYLLNRLPEYTVMPVGDEIYIEAMPLRGISNKPLFDEWMNKTYGQVLESFWKRWGFVLFEIIKNPEKPMSFLFDDAGNPVSGAAIELPR